MVITFWGRNQENKKQRAQDAKPIETQTKSVDASASVDMIYFT